MAHDGDALEAEAEGVAGILVRVVADLGEDLGIDHAAAADFQPLLALDLGAGAGANPVFYTNSGSGVGGGLIINGKIYHGVKPGEAELGHLRLDKGGTIVEDRCSGWSVDRKIRALISDKPKSVLSELALGASTVDARLLVPALARDCALARQIVADAADDLAFALSHVTQLFHPAVIVLGGGLSMVGEPWRAAVATALPRYVMDAFAPGPRVLLTTLAEDAVPVGALLLARDRLLVEQ